jgi:hypothetical protein
MRVSGALTHTLPPLSQESTPAPCFPMAEVRCGASEDRRSPTPPTPSQIACPGLQVCVARPPAPPAGPAPAPGGPPAAPGVRSAGWVGAARTWGSTGYKSGAQQLARTGGVASGRRQQPGRGRGKTGWPGTPPAPAVAAPPHGRAARRAGQEGRGNNNMKCAARQRPAPAGCVQRRLRQ